MVSTGKSDGAAFADRNERVVNALIGAVVGVFFVVFFNLVGPLQVKSDPVDGMQIVEFDFSRLVVNWAHYRDLSGRIVSERNWFSVQAFMWVAFFIGLAEIWTRRKLLVLEKGLKKKRILPEDEGTLLTSSDLKPIYQKARTFSSSSLIKS